MDRCQWAFVVRGWERDPEREGYVRPVYGQCYRGVYGGDFCHQHEAHAITEVFHCKQCLRYYATWYSFNHDYCDLCAERLGLRTTTWGEVCELGVCETCGRLDDARKITYRHWRGENWYWSKFYGMICPRCWIGFKGLLRQEKECRSIRRSIESIKQELRHGKVNTDGGATAGIPGQYDDRGKRRNARQRQGEQNHENGSADQRELLQRNQDRAHPA